jgi:hypothetical protein
MQEKTITRDEAIRTIKLWQRERRPVEVRVSFSGGVTQTHPGRVTVEPEDRVVVAHVANRDQYLTTVIEVSAFDVVYLIESENAITFAEPPIDIRGPINAVTIACRQPSR